MQMIARAMVVLRKCSNGVVDFVLFTRSKAKREVKLFRNKCVWPVRACAVVPVLCGRPQGDACVKKLLFNGSGYRFQEFWGFVDLGHLYSIN
jgi:hypothetical protein